MKKETLDYLKSIITEEVIITVVVTIREVLIAKYSKKSGC